MRLWLLARGHGGRVRLLLDAARHAEHRCRRACGASLPRGRGLRAGRGADRVRPALRPRRRRPARSIRCRRPRCRPICSAHCSWCSRRRHDTAALIVFTLMIVATLAIAWRTDAAGGTIPVAAVFSAHCRAALGAGAGARPSHRAGRPRGLGRPQPSRFDAGPHLVLGAGFAVLFGAAGYLAQSRRREQRCQATAVLWSGSGVAVPLADPGCALLPHRTASSARSRSPAWRCCSPRCTASPPSSCPSARSARPSSPPARCCDRHRRGARAGADLLAGKRLAHRRARPDGAGHRLDRQRTPAADAALARRRCRPCWWSCAIGYEPRIVGSDVGTTPIFNWILYGYGIPAVAFWVAGHLLRKARRRHARPAWSKARRSCSPC